MYHIRNYTIYIRNGIPLAHPNISHMHTFSLSHRHSNGGLCKVIPKLCRPFYKRTCKEYGVKNISRDGVEAHMKSSLLIETRLDT